MDTGNPLISTKETRNGNSYILSSPPGGIVFWPKLVESAQWKGQPTGKHEVDLFYTGGHAKLMAKAYDFLLEEAGKKFPELSGQFKAPYKDHEEQDGTEGVLFKFKVNTHLRKKDGSQGRPVRIDLFGPDRQVMDSDRRDEITMGSKVQIIAFAYMYEVQGKSGITLQPQAIFVEEFGYQEAPVAADAKAAGFITPDQMDALA